MYRINAQFFLIIEFFSEQQFLSYYPQFFINCTVIFLLVASGLIIEKFYP